VLPCQCGSYPHLSARPIGYWAITIRTDPSIRLASPARLAFFAGNTDTLAAGSTEDRSALALATVVHQQNALKLGTLLQFKSAGDRNLIRHLSSVK